MLRALILTKQWHNGAVCPNIAIQSAGSSDSSSRVMSALTSEALGWVQCLQIVTFKIFLPRDQVERPGKVLSVGLKPDQLALCATT